MTERKGTTLVELMVALAIGALVLATVLRFVNGVRSALQAVDDGRATLAAEGVGLRRIDALFQSTLVRHDSLAFVGDSSSMHFCVGSRSGASADRRCDMVSVSINPESARVEARGVERQDLRVTLPLASGSFDYLSGRGLTSQWLSRWMDAPLPPSAVRLRARRANAHSIDTLVFLVGTKL